MARLRWPFLRHHRAEALSALALAAGAGEPLPQALARLAVDDPLLRPAAAALIPRLERGEVLPDALLAVRLVTPGEARRLAEADGRRLAGLLARLAAGAGDPTPGYALVRWFPVWVAVALVAPGVVLSCLMGVFISGQLASILAEAGMRFPVGLFALAYQPPGIALAWGAVAITAIWMATFLLGRIRGLRHVFHTFAPDVHRQRALVRLVRAVMSGDDSPVSGPCWTRMGLTARRHDQPQWDEDWRTWLFLTRFRMRKGERQAASDSPALGERMRLLGLAPSGTAYADWDGFLEAVTEDYRGSVAAIAPLLSVVIMLAVMVGFVGQLAWPLVKTMEVISGIGYLSLPPHPADGVWPMLRDVLLLSSVATAAIGVLFGAWAVLRLIWSFAVPSPPASITRMIAHRLLAAEGKGQLDGDALRSLAARVRWPWGWRLRRAAGILDQQAPPSTPDAMTDCHLLPTRIAASGNAAISLGRVAWRRWLAGLEQSLPRRNGIMGPILMRHAIGAAFMLVMLSFVTIAIIPKFETIFKDLGMVPGPHFLLLMEWIGVLRSWWWMLAIVGLPMVIAAAWVLSMRREARVARLLRGHIVLAGVQAGHPEAEIGLALQHEAGDGPAMERVAEAGDFRSLCRRCGWSVADPRSLAEAIVRSEWVSRRWQVARGMLMEIAMPVLFGIPVWMVFVGLFQPIIDIMVQIAKDAS